MATLREVALDIFIFWVILNLVFGVMLSMKDSNGAYIVGFMEYVKPMTTVDQQAMIDQFNSTKVAGWWVQIPFIGTLVGDIANGVRYMWNIFSTFLSGFSVTILAIFKPFIPVANYATLESVVTIFSTLVSMAFIFLLIYMISGREI